MNRQKIYSKVLSFMLCLAMVLPGIIVLSDVAYAKRDTVLNSKVIVSMGDSYSAGEGIPQFYGQNGSSVDKVKDQDWLAHRSKNSWPGQLTLPAVSGEMATHHGDDTYWYFVATSGATTAHINNRQPKEYDYDGYEGTNYIDAQINVFKELGDRKADYVTLTIGGNDAQFSEVVTCAVLPHLNPNALSDKINGIWDDLQSCSQSLRYGIPNSQTPAPPRNHP